VSVQDLYTALISHPDWFEVQTLFALLQLLTENLKDLHSHFLEKVASM
jgi:hypothetical protein